MNRTFKPQVTNLNSYQDAEKNIYSQFVGVGYDETQAAAVAHTFTQLTLGYLTVEGAAQKMLATGISENVVRKLVTMFHDAIERSAARSRTGTH